MENKKALLTGVTGQDGSYLSELLLSKGYEVYGMVRRSSVSNVTRINQIYHHPRFHLYYADLLDSGSIRKLIYTIKPSEIYNLAAQSHVKVSFEIPEYTAEADAIGPIRILDAIKDFQEETGNQVKFYQATSSEMFGASPPPQNETTLFQPRSPYACAKVFAYYITKNYRQAYNIFAVNGILMNHESPRRGETFVTRKITKGIAKILKGEDKYITLGNLEAMRDWGFALEFVECMWKMLQQDKPDDYVIGTGEAHSVREFLDEAFSYAGLGNYEKYIKVDKMYLRPIETNTFLADSSKARRLLGWEPKVRFKELVHMMVDADLKDAGVEIARK